MTNTGKQIANLMIDTGKSGAEMSHAVKVLGNGSMQRGFARIGEYYTAENAIALSKGRLQGGVIVLGVLGTIGAIKYSIDKYKSSHAHINEGKIIFDTINNSQKTDDDEQ